MMNVRSEWSKLLASVLISFIVASLIVVGCTPSGQVNTPAKETSTSTPASATKAGWQQDWDSAVAQAKVEGRVTVYTILGPDPRVALSEAFKKKFGIEVEFATFARAVEVAAKAEAEKTAGLFVVDVFFNGTSTALSTMKPAGLLGPMEPLLILPEVTDPGVWMGGRVPFVDQKDKKVMAITAAANRFVAYNTDLIKKDEIAAYKDVLKPQYKGKITLNDPSFSGQGSSMMAFLAQRLWKPDEASDFLTRLIREQDVVIERDQRLHMETVARGKYAIALGPDPQTFVQFFKTGAPVAQAIIKEGITVEAATGGFSVPTKFAHPNAAKVFVNWLLSKEGQTVFAPAHGYPSVRTDVPTTGIDPSVLAQPGEKLFFLFQDEEMAIYRTTVNLDINKKIMAEAQK